MKNLEERLKQAKLVYFEHVRLRDGEISDYYFDIKKGYGDVGLLKQLTEALWDQIDKQTTCIAAAGYGGIPLAVSLSLEHSLHLVLVRDKPKKHGKGAMIDGYIPREDDYISVVDDVFTTGSSMRQTIRALSETDAKILGCHVVVKRGEGELSVPLTYLIDSKLLL